MHNLLRYLFQLIAQKISDLYVVGQEALDVKLAQDRFLHCMIFETYEPSEQKIKSTPFAQAVFQHSFEVRSKMDRLLNFAFRISELML